MKLFFLSLLSFFFIATSTLAITKFIPAFKNEISKVAPTENFENTSLPMLPVLTGSNPSPSFTAHSVLAVDVSSQVNLYEKDPDSRVLPASTTKIVTALVAMDFSFPAEILTVGEEARIEGQKMGLVKGERILVEDLLYGLLVFSANDAAEVLANNYPGGRASFITAMNLKAEDLNLFNTSFNNPSGLDGNGLMTSARDLVRVAEFAMENSLFRKIVGTEEKVVEGSEGKFKHKLVNLNELLGKEEGVLGVKTGWTEGARENLVTYVDRDGKKIIIVVLGSQDRFGETKVLLDWIFENYEWKEVTGYSS
ncbi:hypothetical protein A3A75_06285 [Candidatus Woesebacteria bacterium RIFCSPLOWO2_01_FULL_39_10]|uniref:Peptidase S11 D-alanyl-D-alanine carboxypeptidase A N-terminal domain-containing protein n=1 Tax=Candidatus Woesebacteria bacterium RIFCSPLOWO2_01_FULL_39_10 TaxID=1802516 RepID=A0A1F8B476_9BACT|nr:MAG: hypothetical protein A3A75_06285 [Candidatus Woesebacteria bacterium RIFCSPLOWO2_01_FULL_39_10]